MRKTARGWNRGVHRCVASYDLGDVANGVGRLGRVSIGRVEVDGVSHAMAEVSFSDTADDLTATQRQALHATPEGATGSAVTVDRAAQWTYDQPRQMALYAFTGNNALRYVDPDGLCFGPVSVWICAGVVAGIIGSESPANAPTHNNPKTHKRTPAWKAAAHAAAVTGGGRIAGAVPKVAARAGQAATAGVSAATALTEKVLTEVLKDVAIGGGLVGAYMIISPSGGGDGPKIHDGKQGKHVPGHNNFIEGRSELTHADPQGLLDRFAGSGTEHGSKEVVDFGEEIGVHVAEDGTRTRTTRGTIHYDTKGSAHIVPATPTEEVPQ